MIWNWRARRDLGRPHSCACGFIDRRINAPWHNMMNDDVPCPSSQAYEDLALLFMQGFSTGGPRTPGVNERSPGSRRASRDKLIMLLKHGVIIHGLVVLFIYCSRVGHLTAPRNAIYSTWWNRNDVSGLLFVLLVFAVTVRKRSRGLR